LVARGLRETSEISLVMPLGAPIPLSPAASAALLVAFAERGIVWYPERLVCALDPGRRVAALSEGAELPYDLFLGAPVRRAPQVVQDAGMCVDGWIPVDPRTLETTYPDVYAVGDVTSVRTPKAGVFAEGQAAVVAEAISARHRGQRTASTYGGRGVCYVEFGDDLVARVDVTAPASGRTGASTTRPRCTPRTRPTSDQAESGGGSAATGPSPGQPHTDRFADHPCAGLAAPGLVDPDDRGKRVDQRRSHGTVR
jgi:sulfide:quinone oxidoreductase